MVNPQRFVANLKGMKCWTAKGPILEGSFYLHLGRTSPVESPESVKFRGRKLRLFEPEQAIQVYCPWRLDGADKPLASFRSDKDTIRDALKALEGQVVSDVSCRLPGMDLDLAFNKGVILHLFAASQVHEPGFSESWSYCASGKRLTVSSDFSWAIDS